MVFPVLFLIFHLYHSQVSYHFPIPWAFCRSVDVRFKLLFSLMKLSIKNENKTNRVEPLCLFSLFQQWVEGGAVGREQSLPRTLPASQKIPQKKEPSLATKREEGTSIHSKGHKKATVCELWGHRLLESSQAPAHSSYFLCLGIQRSTCFYIQACLMATKYLVHLVRRPGDI